MPRRRTVGLVGATAYAAALLWVLLSPSAEVPISVVGQVSETLRAWGLAPSASGPAEVEVALNVLMFLPFGIVGWAVHDGWWHPWSAAACGVLVSVVVETVQGLLLDGRSASLIDVAANGVGAGLGGILGTVLAQLTWPGRRPAR